MPTSNSSAPTTGITDSTLQPAYRRENYLYYEKYEPDMRCLYILFPPGLPLFWNFHLAVTGDRKFLKVGFSSFFKRRIPIHQITEVEIVDNVCDAFSGLFYRINTACESAYVSKVSGPGLRVTYKPTTRQRFTIAFNCGDPVRLRALLTGTSVMTDDGRNGEPASPPMFGEEIKT